MSDPRWSPGGARLAWVERFDGRSDVVVSPADGSGPPVVVTGECGVAGGYAWVDDDALVVAGRDGRLVAVHADGGVIRVLTTEGQALAPSVSARGEVACAIERDDACDIATLTLDGDAWPARVSRADYAWDPSWSPDGRVLVWHEWDLPGMPWQESRIMRRDSTDEKPSVVAAGPDCGQPRFAPDGRKLAWIAGGALVVDGEPVLAERFEHAEPSWGSGQRSYAWSPSSDELAWCRNEDGFGRLVIGAPGRKSARELSRGWHRGLDWSEHGIVCVRSGAVTPTQIVVLAPNGSARRSLARGPVGGFERTPLVEPRAVSWRSGAATVRGLLWRPAGATEPLPMVVHVHGGPTDQAAADWNPRVQWLVQRGYVVLQPNFRGSTGFGTAYREALDGHWGERDVADVAAGIKHAVKEGWAVSGRIALMGGSAGGLTVLNVAALHPDLVAAAIALYPVTDLLDLDATTHRFESGYTASLVGPLPEARDVYLANSAITHAAKIRAAVLLLHGADDKVVVPAQSAAVDQILQRTGTHVERVVYDGEGHGWRNAATIADELARVEAFLARWC
ncbi:MAG TPA: prolyl oligopeptidase family serine peptidase [Acidimicrobiia bacterium]|nr:prolyl oligopeptidase family serine peptidase [Acidimicrobiia bacterium]